MTHPTLAAAGAEGIREAVRELAGDADPSGVLLMRLVRMIANQYDTLEDDTLSQAGVSGPRWAILMRLMAAERHGGTEGMSPTQLSRCQNVSKNTISALLAGLEERGFIERTLRSDDRRAFHIRMTDAGRALIHDSAPRHIAFLNRLVSGLSDGERAQLNALLEKLHRSIEAHAGRS